MKSFNINQHQKFKIIFFYSSFSKFLLIFEISQNLLFQKTLIFKISRTILIGIDASEKHYFILD